MSHVAMSVLSEDDISAVKALVYWTHLSELKPQDQQDAPEQGP